MINELFNNIETINSAQYYSEMDTMLELLNCYSKEIEMDMYMEQQGLDPITSSTIFQEVNSTDNTPITGDNPQSKPEEQAQDKNAIPKQLHEELPTKSPDLQSEDDKKQQNEDNQQQNENNQQQEPSKIDKFFEMLKAFLRKVREGMANIFSKIGEFIGGEKYRQAQETAKQIDDGIYDDTSSFIAKAASGQIEQPASDVQDGNNGAPQPRLATTDDDFEWGFVDESFEYDFEYIYDEDDYYQEAGIAAKAIGAVIGNWAGIDMATFLKGWFTGVGNYGSIDARDSMGTQDSYYSNILRQWYVKIKFYMKAANSGLHTIGAIVAKVNSELGTKFTEGNLFNLDSGHFLGVPLPAPLKNLFETFSGPLQIGALWVAVDLAFKTARRIKDPATADNNVIDAFYASAMSTANQLAESANSMFQSQQELFQWIKMLNEEKDMAANARTVDEVNQHKENQSMILDQIDAMFRQGKIADIINQAQNNGAVQEKRTNILFKALSSIENTICDSEWWNEHVRGLEPGDVEYGRGMIADLINKFSKQIYEVTKILDGFASIGSTVTSWFADLFSGALDDHEQRAIDAMGEDDRQLFLKNKGLREYMLDGGNNENNQISEKYGLFAKDVMIRPKEGDPDYSRDATAATKQQKLEKMKTDPEFIESMRYLGIDPNEVIIRPLGLEEGLGQHARDLLNSANNSKVNDAATLINQSSIPGSIKNTIVNSQDDGTTEQDLLKGASTLHTIGDIAGNAYNNLKHGTTYVDPVTGQHTSNQSEYNPNLIDRTVDTVSTGLQSMKRDVQNDMARQVNKDRIRRELDQADYDQRRYGNQDEKIFHASDEENQAEDLANAKGQNKQKRGLFNWFGRK